MYAEVINETVTHVRGLLPESARRLDTQQWVLGLRTAEKALQEVCGWFVVDESAVKPDDTVTTYWQQTVQLVNLIPTVVWTELPKSVEQILSESRDSTAASLKAQARTAYTNNQTFLGIASPNNAQNAAQIRALTNQMQAVIRLLVANDMLD